MARYIDAYELEKDFPQDVPKHNAIINGNEYPVFLVDHVLHKIRNYPTADVVEVKQIEIIRDDLKWWLETNSEKGVVYIPKCVVENMIAKMEGDKSDG